MRALFVILLFAVADAQAAPFRDLRVAFTQPDGARIEVIGTGDEFYAVFETDEGFTAVFDPSLRAYCFAALAPDGTLVSSGKQIHQFNPARLGIPKHLRMGKQARTRQVVSRWQRWEAGMQVEQAWKERKAALRQYQKLAKETGPQPSPPPFSTAGIKVGLTLLIDFDDDPATVPQAEIVDFCNGDSYTGFGNNGSVKKYYLDVSNGLLTYSNIVTVYIRIPNSLHPKSWYNDTTKDCGDQGNLLVRDAISVMRSLPNYESEILPAFAGLTVDNNNRVVAFNVFYAGGNGNVWNYGLWPHSWSLSNVGAQELSPGGTRVYKYQITNIGGSLALGTFCHENGHMLCGFPDVYDYDYDSKGGAGVFCLMGTGSSGGNPAQICAYLKRAAGWATTMDLNSSSAAAGSLTAVAGPDFNRFYRFQKPGEPTEYFLLEARYATGRDANLPASGVAIWHIDELGDHNNQSLLPNSSHLNYEVTLVQADNQWDLESNVNGGDANDLYSFQNTAAAYSNDFSDGSSPDAQWWDGIASGAAFHGFSARATTMTFQIGYTNVLPDITVQPQSRTVMAYRSVTLSVGARGSAPLSYQWYFGGSPINGATANSYTISSVAASDDGDYYVVVTNSLGSATSQTARLTVLPGVSLPDALDAPGLTWTTGGTTAWESQTDITHDTLDAAQSGRVGDQQESWVETTIPNGPGTLGFWWRVSSETNYDILELNIDGVRSSAISGEVGWEWRTAYLPAGSHKVQWRYAKDESVLRGQDRGWLDQVSFVPDGPAAPVILTQPQSRAVVKGSVASFAVSVAGSSPLGYQWSFNHAPIPGANLSSYTILSAAASDAGAYQVEITNSLGAATSQVATLTVLEGLSLRDALDAPALSWNSGGTAEWQAQTSVTHDGIDAAQSGTISHSQESWLETTVATGPGKLSFWWKVSSEPDWDYLEFYVDQSRQARISGDLSWQQATFPVAAGSHTLRWRYIKDGSVSGFQDAGWVDQVSFVPDVADPPSILSSRFVGGHFECAITGTTGRAYEVLASTNLVDWVPVQTNTAPFTFTDPLPEPASMRFYRARSQP